MGYWAEQEVVKYLIVVPNYKLFTSDPVRAFCYYSTEDAN